MKLKIFSFAHKPVDFLTKLSQTIIPVGIGKSNFSKNWIDTNQGDNINHKHMAYAEMTGHYWVWKNFILKNLDEDIWVGFSQYRRHWLKYEPFKSRFYHSSFVHDFFKIFIKRLASSRLTSFSKYLVSAYKNYDYETIDPSMDTKYLQNFLLNKVGNDWGAYDVILPKPVFLGDNIKKQYFESKDIPDQLINQILFNMPINLKNKFIYHLSNERYLSPHNMYIAKPKILNEYFSFSFDLYKKLENITNKETGLKIIDTPRFYGTLNERMANFWFKDCKKFKTLPIRFLSNIEKSED